VVLRLGLIGCGILGKVHAECVQESSQARMVAFADVNLSAAESLATSLDGEYATDDVNRVIHDPSISAVYICTRHDSHAPLAIAAAEAGKHIFIEKPLALNIEDCTAIARAIDESNVFLMTGFKLRYYPLVLKARSFIPSPQVMVGQCMDNPWSDTHWGQDPIQGGGNVYGQGCHMTDILRFLSGSEPSRVWAAGGAMTHPGHSCIDQCVATFQFKNGHVASWIQGDLALGRFTSKFFVQLWGAGKCVQLHDRLTKAVFVDGDKTWTEERDSEEGFVMENREFIGALLQGRSPSTSVHDGVQAIRMVLAADRAVRTGNVQEL
jgi:predicted dehydrogenase